MMGSRKGGGLMDTKEVLAELRRSRKLTQEEMAEKLLVTRQAVSRWETGETIPNTETLKLISREFGISINELLGQPQERHCQSCAMPLVQLDDFGSAADGGLSTEYCTHCYQNGSFTSERTLEEMIESNLKFLHEWNAGQGTSFSEEEARAILTVHLASLKRWKASSN